MTTFNDLINHEVQSFVDPGLGLVPFATGGDSHLDYTRKGEEMWLDIKVSKV